MITRSSPSIRSPLTLTAPCRPAARKDIFLLDVGVERELRARRGVLRGWVVFAVSVGGGDLEAEFCADALAS